MKYFIGSYREMKRRRRQGLLSLLLFRLGETKQIKNSNKSQTARGSGVGVIGIHFGHLTALCLIFFSKSYKSPNRV